MKTVLLLMTAGMLMVTSVTAQKSKLTRGERTFMVNFLTATQQKLVETVNGIDDELWNYRPAPDQWSTAECMEHIVFAESQLSKRITENMILDENRIDRDLSPEDGIVIARLTDRTNR